MFLFVAETAAGGGLNIQGQLARGNTSRAENAHGQSAEEHCFDLLHGRFTLGQLPDGELAGLANVKLHMPMLVPGCEKTQVQPRMLGQPALLVQKPRQLVL
jgi:hypothetical protein